MCLKPDFDYHLFYIYCVAFYSCHAEETVEMVEKLNKEVFLLILNLVKRTWAWFFALLF